MTYTPILGTLGYVISPDKQKVLLVHRNAREDDEHLGKYNGLGGKMESTEDVITGMKREIFEEAGIECTEMVLRGTVNWTNFGPKYQNWLGFIFRIDAFIGTPHESNIEGNLEWIDIDQLLNVPMWEGDRHFLPMIFDENPRPFHGYMPYDCDKMLSWSFCR